MLKGAALLRLDFNEEGDWRLCAVLPTIRFLLQHSLKIVIISHKGRPNGYDKKLSLRKDGLHLQKFLGHKVRFVSDLNFSVIKKVVDRSPRGSVLLLENLRFWKGEEQNDAKFAKKLASLASYYVNDAFAVSHRKNASVVAVTKFLPSYAGFELEAEIKTLSKVMRSARHPLVVVLGGAKAGDKLGVLKYFRNETDCFLLGGAAANTLLSLTGVDMGKSLMDEDKKDVKELAKILRYKNLFLPQDLIFHNNAALDIGRMTAAVFAEKLSQAKTVIWNGPLGLFENKPYDRGTLEVAKAIVKNRRAFSLAGGGETAAFLEDSGLGKKFDFVSTGGGAMLDYLAGKELPGIRALQNNR